MTASLRRVVHEMDSSLPLFAARMLRHLLHAISAADPFTLVGAGTLAVIVSLLACCVPARRAAAVSPAELLRE